MRFAPRLLTLALGTLMATSAYADEAQIKAAVKTIKETATIKSIRDIPITGIKEVIADNTVVYMDPTGRYLFFGTLLDLQEKRNLSDDAAAMVRKESLLSIPAADKIVYEPKVVKHRVTVFTDISCGYCHKVHENLKGYMDRGIAIEFVPYPRGGQQNPAWNEMRKIWCAKDRNAAYDAASAGKTIPGEASCDDPVARTFALGESLAFEGTPAMYSADGKQLGGYVPPEEMAQRLDKEAAQNAAGKTAPPPADDKVASK